MRRIRKQLNLAPFELANWLGLSQGAGAGRWAGSAGAKRVVEMEREMRSITGPIATLMRAFADGWTPEGTDHGAQAGAGEG